MWNIESIASKGDYFYAKVPNHPEATSNGYVLEHRVVMENHMGRLLTQDEVVHHENENKKDNRIENLELMTRAEHSKLHAMKPGLIILVCTDCGVSFQRRRNQRSSVKGYVNAFCSRSCNGKYQRRKQLAAPVSALASNQLKR